MLEESVEVSKAVLELAKALQEYGTKLEFFKPLLANSNWLKELINVLCSPELQIAGVGLPFVGIAIKLFNSYRDHNRTEPTLEECVAVISRLAYLKSFAENITKFPDLLARWESQSNSNEALKKALQSLNDFKLEAQAIDDAIVSFYHSQLAQHFNQVLSARLQQTGLPSNKAEDFTTLVARNTERYFIQVLVESRESAQPLSQLFENNGIEVIKKYRSIEKYLQKPIEPIPSILKSA